MTDTVPLTYKELGERLGMSPDSARIKAKRRKWAVVPGNHPSEPVRVLVPLEVLEGERSPERSGGGRSPDTTGEIKALQAHIETLKQQLAHEQAARENERAHARELVDRLDKLAREHTSTAAELALVQVEFQGTMERLQAEGSRLWTELEQARRPWWWRWMGG